MSCMSSRGGFATIYVEPKDSGRSTGSHRTLKLPGHRSDLRLHQNLLQLQTSSERIYSFALPFLRLLDVLLDHHGEAQSVKKDSGQEEQRPPRYVKGFLATLHIPLD